MIVASVVVAALSSAASADFTYKVEQVGSDVVIDGSGSVDLTGLTLEPPAFSLPSPTVVPNSGIIVTGVEDANGGRYIDAGATSTAFGDSFDGGSAPDGVVSALQSDYFGFTRRSSFFGGGVVVYVPDGYVSGDLISSSLIYSDTTLGELGFFDSGSYTSTLSNGTELTVSIVPEPASAAVASLAATLLLRRRR
jgi:hypothetical protein